MIVRSKLHLLIFVAMVLGGVVGMLLWGLEEGGSKDSALWVLDLFGRTIFVVALTMIVAPLIFCPSSWLETVHYFLLSDWIGFQLFRY